jgi:nitrate/nitrite transporter NarK
MVLFAANSMFGALVTGTAVNNWFIEKRGRAMGIATIGFSLSGASLPLLAMLILKKTDIETAAEIIGFAMMLVGPLSRIFIKNWPEEYDLLPDGKIQPKIIKISTTSKVETDRSEIWTFKTIITSGTFWKIGIVYICAITVLTGTMTQLKPRFTSQGFSDLEAMLMMAVTALIGAFGKVCWGQLCDRYDPKKIIAVFLACNSLGIALSLIPDSMVATGLFILVFGFAIGGASGTYPIVISYYFGRRSFPVVMKYLSLLLMFNLIGLVIDGQSFDRFGSYDPAYIIFMIMDFCAIFVMLSIKFPAKKIKNN